MHEDIFIQYWKSNLKPSPEHTLTMYDIDIYLLASVNPQEIGISEYIIALQCYRYCLIVMTIISKIKLQTCIVQKLSRLLLPKLQ